MTPIEQITALLILIGSIGFLTFAFVFIGDALREENTGDEDTDPIEEQIKIQRFRWVSALSVVILLASISISADSFPNSACTEANLRAVCGDFWEVCWWTLGCIALPG